MLFFEIVLVALQSIRANLFRAMLTMLGIIIGVGAVIAMLAAGAGAQKRIDEQIAALGSNILSINASNFYSGGISREQMTIRIEDAHALAADARYLDAVVPELQARGQLKFGNENTNTRVIGTTAHFDKVFNYKMAVGRFFSLSEDERSIRTIVLGSEIPDRLGTTAEEIVGRDVAVNGQPFRVVGVMQSVGGGLGNQSPDSTVFIPLTTAERRVVGRARLNNINVRVADGVEMERAMADIERVLRREHKLLPGTPNDFSILDRREFLDTQQQAQQTFTMLLASIAGVSLLVGGIGIMNIMLVSVTERTREIGVRMALGATRFSIMLQFLVESVTLCVLGGFLGVLLGMSAASLLARFAGWETFVSPESIGLASAFSVGVGLFFGIWPARRAARLDPIEALRYE